MNAFVGTVSAFALLAAMFSAPAALAKPKDRPERPEMLTEGAQRILAHARKVREDTGCLEAAPGLRVVAAMGEGQEAAQHELGECLLLIAGARPDETALFRQEAEFWLARAAFAGNARAQRALAIHYGTASNADASPAAALKWALVYEKNGEGDVYGYKTLPPTFVPGLKSGLAAADIAMAEAFATDFAPIALKAFTPPPREKVKRPDGPPLGGRTPDGRPGAAAGD